MTGPVEERNVTVAKRFRYLKGEDRIRSALAFRNQQVVTVDKWGNEVSGQLISVSISTGGTSFDHMTLRTPGHSVDTLMSLATVDALALDGARSSCREVEHATGIECYLRLDDHDFHEGVTVERQTSAVGYPLFVRWPANRRPE
jgi:hypothetical protein